jgi:ubiquinone/menaquinone biosynthesis C-methylase UbiE
MRTWSRRLVSTFIDLNYMAMALGPAKRPASLLYRRLLNAYYWRQADRYDETVICSEGEHYGRALEAGLKRISVQPQRIIDVNTGTGYVAMRLKQAFPNARVTGTDLSEAMLRKAEEKAKSQNTPIEFSRADGARLPFDAETFDLITLQNAPPNIIELARVLRPGGQLLMAYTSGSLVPRYWRRRLQQALTAFGFHQVETGHEGDGLWIVATK